MLMTKIFVIVIANLICFCHPQSMFAQDASGRSFQGSSDPSLNNVPDRAYNREPPQDPRVPYNVPDSSIPALPEQPALPSQTLEGPALPAQPLR